MVQVAVAVGVQAVVAFQRPAAPYNHVHMAKQLGSRLTCGPAVKSNRWTRLWSPGRVA